MSSAVKVQYPRRVGNGTTARIAHRDVVRRLAHAAHLHFLGLRKQNDGALMTEADHAAWLLARNLLHDLEKSNGSSR